MAPQKANVSSSSWEKTEEELKEEAKVVPALQKKWFRVLTYTSCSLLAIILLFSYLHLATNQANPSPGTKQSSSQIVTATSATNLYDICSNSLPKSSNGSISIVRKSTDFPGFYFKISSLDSPSPYAEWTACILNNSGDTERLSKTTGYTIVKERGFSVFLISRPSVKEYAFEGIFFDDDAEPLSVAGHGCSGLYKDEYAKTWMELGMDDDKDSLSMTLYPSASFNQQYLSSCVHAIIELPSNILKKTESFPNSSDKMMWDEWDNYMIMLSKKDGSYPIFEVISKTKSSNSSDTDTGTSSASI